MPVSTTNRTADEWFRAAEHAYAVGHQACPWCHGAHRVFAQWQGGQIVYHCQGCDFEVCLNQGTGHCSFIPGEEPRTVPDTMHD